MANAFQDDAFQDNAFQEPAGPAAAPFTPGPIPNPQLARPLGISLRTWTASYNLNLIGQDALPFRRSDWPNPLLFKRLSADWNWNGTANQPVVVVQAPFNLDNCPNPFARRPLTQTSSGS